MARASITAGNPLEEQILHLLDEKISMFELVRSPAFTKPTGAATTSSPRFRDLVEDKRDCFLHAPVRVLLQSERDRNGRR